MPLLAPHYRHDSTCCEFLGQFILVDDIYDIYVCDQGMGSRFTVILRTGDETHEYWSYSYFSAEQEKIRPMTARRYVGNAVASWILNNRRLEGV